MRCVYKRPQGGKLLNERHHPEAIKDYLRAEAAQIAQKASGYEVLLELGCSAGRYAGLARRLGLRYVGVDKEARYLRRARRRYPEAQLLKGRVDIALLQQLQENYGAQRVLVVLPFNFLGILSEPESFLEHLLKAKGWGFFISLFQTTAEANKVRRCYYASASLKKLHCIRNEKGMLFRAAGGFASIAYHPFWIVPLLKSARPTVQHLTGAIAVVYFRPPVF